jgi:hypothetical protein
MKRILFIFVLTVQVCFFGAPPAYASEKLAQIPLPDSLSPELQHLLSLADPRQSPQFDPARVAKILEFIETPKNPNVLYHADEIAGAPSAYYEFDVHRSLADRQRYAFNPDIPGSVMSPASIRVSNWQQVENHAHSMPDLWKEMAALDGPSVIRGVEEMENTPDTFSGAYYKYDLDRSLVLFKNQDRRALISISRQKDVSNVGHRGYVLGSDRNWDYLYTGKPGLTISGLGWVRSYMYDSAGILVYYELAPGAPMVRCAIFKWVRAGWSRINVVRRFHIYEGLLRFANSYKEILESSHLPSADAMAGFFTRIRALDIGELRKKFAVYPAILKNRYPDPPPGAKWTPKLFDNRDYWANLSREEMQSLIMLEYMKSALGKSNKDEVAELLSN